MQRETPPLKDGIGPPHNRKPQLSSFWAETWNILTFKFEGVASYPAMLTPGSVFRGPSVLGVRRGSDAVLVGNQGQLHAGRAPSLPPSLQPPTLTFSNEEMGERMKRGWLCWLRLQFTSFHISLPGATLEGLKERSHWQRCLLVGLFLSLGTWADTLEGHARLCGRTCLQLHIPS